MMVLLHGLEDNAGTFDRIVPLLPATYYYVSVDLPGHGKSDHFPSNLPLHSVDYIFACKIVLDHFGRKKYTLFGHSFGGMVGFMCSVVYPELLEKLIVLDCYVAKLVTPKEFPKWMASKYDNFMQVQKQIVSRRANVELDRDRAMEVLSSMRNHNGELTTDAAKTLLERAVENVGNKCRFRRDLRLKCYMELPLDTRYIQSVLRENPVQIPVLLMITESTSIHPYFTMKETLDVLGEFKNLKKVIVGGNHNVHLNEPEIVAPCINEFLNSS